jgi:hypothetical protein
VQGTRLKINERELWVFCVECRGIYITRTRTRKRMTIPSWLLSVVFVFLYLLCCPSFLALLSLYFSFYLLTRILNTSVYRKRYKLPFRRCLFRISVRLITVPTLFLSLSLRIPICVILTAQDLLVWKPSHSQPIHDWPNAPVSPKAII